MKLQSALSGRGSLSMPLDHLAWAAPDLESGTAMFQQLTGVSAVTGGNHPGNGTWNRLVGLGGGTYLEILSVDPRQGPKTKQAEMVAALPHPALVAFAVQISDIDAACAAAEAAGVTVAERRPMSRTRPDGIKLEWTLVHLSHPDYGIAIPPAIDWQAISASVGNLTGRLHAEEFDRA